VEQVGGGALQGQGGDRGFDVLAAAPPLQLNRLLFRMAMVKRSIGGDDEDVGPVKLMHIDVKKTFKNGKVAEGEFVSVLLTNGASGGVGQLRSLLCWAGGVRLGRPLCGEVAGGSF
jgi:hypothetical protein